MAVAKATTTADVKSDDGGSGDVKYVTLTSPIDGKKTQVPVGIADALKASGYKSGK